MPRLPEGRSGLLFGGLVPTAHRRAAAEAQGWVAPLMGRQILEHGVAAVRRAWVTAETAAAGLSALHQFLDHPSIDQLSQVLGLSHSGAVRL